MWVENYCVRFGKFMSRIGKKTITIPQGVTVSVDNGVVSVKGAKGELKTEVPKGIVVKVEGQDISVTRVGNQPSVRALHGLIRSLIANHIEGVVSGFKKTLKLVGTGYRVKAQGQSLSVTVGYSHPVEIKPEQGIQLKVEGNDTIIVEGIDKQAVGQFAANVRKIRPPESYKGKGIRYEGEYVKIKPGKTAAA